MITTDHKDASIIVGYMIGILIRRLVRRSGKVGG